MWKFTEKLLRRIFPIIQPTTEPTELLTPPGIERVRKYAGDDYVPPMSAVTVPTRWQRNGPDQLQSRNMGAVSAVRGFSEVSAQPVDPTSEMSSRNSLGYIVAGVALTEFLGNNDGRNPAGCASVETITTPTLE